MLLEEGNFEDQIRIANELLRGLEIIGTSEALEGNSVFLRKDLKRILDDFAASIRKCETYLITSKAEYRESAVHSNILLVSL